MSRLAMMIIFAAFAMGASALEISFPTSSGMSSLGEYADLLKILKARYERDISNENGRIAWHGRLILQSVDTNALTKVSTYSDGFVFSEAFKNMDLRASATNALKAIQKKYANVITNGIPEKLAAARAKYAATVGKTNIVNEVITNN